MRTAGVGLFFKNWVISSQRGHSFVKWSPPHSIHEFFSFIVIVGGWFWIFLLVSRFFVFRFTFIFIVSERLNALNRIDLGRNLGSRRSRGGSVRVTWQVLLLMGTELNQQSH